MEARGNSSLLFSYMGIKMATEQLKSQRNAVARQAAVLKQKRDRIKAANKQFKAQKKKSLRDKMNHDIQIHAMENDFFTAKQAWYRLKLNLSSLAKKMKK